jgi:hypothetical protein
VGLITYMRTDSTRVSGEALDAVRHFIGATYGEAYVPKAPHRYKSPKGAQEAHEAIRPTDVGRRPQDVRRFLKKDEFALYELIWRRFVASQMAAATLRPHHRGRGRRGLSLPGHGLGDDLSRFHHPLPGNRRGGGKGGEAAAPETGGKPGWWISTPSSISPSRRPATPRPASSRSWKCRASAGPAPMPPS